ncbi:MAG: aminotransferase class V-fold PLP-dependent enzyme [Betaproteobacteria bacterium]|nr:aminotransferase class V-fold PLP-dependent enzyme [Betaproteobacteria bacterium]
MKHQSGRHFLQIPGPTNVPDRVLRAIDRATVDHRGPGFQEMSKEVLAGLKHVFKTKSPVVIFPASGTGAWEAALVNTLSPGDKVLMFETGHFATLWLNMAKRLGLDPVFVPGDWRHGVDPAQVEAKLAEDNGDAIKAVMVVHNETSTGVVTRVPEVRKSMDRARHPALLMVDTISSLASIDYRHDEWGVDVTVAGSQKGLMLPPGLSFNAVSDKALAAVKKARLPRSYWNWEEMIAANKDGWFPYTPATNLLYGLRVALKMLLEEEGLDNVFKRHDRLAEAARCAVRAWGLEILCANPAEYSSSLTAVLMPQGHGEIAFRELVLERFNLSLGSGLTKLRDKVFRIGHLGDFNDLMLLGTLAGIEMGLALAAVPHRKGGVAAAMEYLASANSAANKKAGARLGVA